MRDEDYIKMCKLDPAMNSRQSNDHDNTTSVLISLLCIFVLIGIISFIFLKG